MDGFQPSIRTFARPASCGLGMLLAMVIAGESASAQDAGKKEESKPIPAWYAKKIEEWKSSGSRLGGMRVKVEEWLDAAEANPAGQITLPPANPADKSAKPRIVPALELVRHGVPQLRQAMGEAPSGMLPFEPMEVLMARLALVEKQPQAAAKRLAVYGLKEGAIFDPAALSAERKEALVWLTLAQLRVLVRESAPPVEKKPASAVELASWLGIPMDWAAGIPKTDKPEINVLPLLQRVDALVQATEGATQLRAAMTVGDACGLLGRWEGAIASYGFVRGQANYLNAKTAEYAIGENPADRKPVSAHLPGEAAAKQAQAGRIVELIKYSAEFVLYRDGHWQMLAGRNQEAIATFEKLLAVAEKNRKDSLAKAVALAVAEAKKGNRPTDKAQKEAEVKWREEAEKNGGLESPFEAAAEVYAAQCRIATGDLKNEAAAIRDLEQFIKADPDGLYRGEALRTVAICALDHFAFDAAKPWLDKLEIWVKQTRERMAKEQWNFAEKLPGISEAAGPLTQAPKEEYAKPDFWGRVRKVGIRPEQLVCERNCAWYLDDLEESLVLYQGFLLLVQNNTPKGRAEAKIKWERLKELEPLCKNDGPTNPTNLTRLRTWCDTGNGYATPSEAATFNGRARQIQCWADFLCATGQWARAERVGKWMADNKAWPIAQREYGLVVQASSASWQGRKREAFFIYKQALATPDKTPSELRCWYSAAQLACCNLQGKEDADLRKEGRAMLEKMAKARLPGEWGSKAIVGLACELSQQKKYDEALAMLDSYPIKTDHWAKIIDLYRQSIAHAKEVNTP